MDIEKTHLEKTLESFEQEDLFSLILRYCLFVGALFQMVCIGACIFLKDPNGEAMAPEFRRRESEDLSNKRHHKQRRTEKKKRR
ncbi:protein anon-73B1 [Condylostylus longicornis]|uniref:protein anon-73B1 n=1 Tax=Condylostylus longicornis TaxID=2530218 RepID=UPI00244DA34D|nr:protein anon-73B1 [Condylostylus longicornis]